MSSRLISIEQVCELLGCSRKTVQRYRKKSGALKFPAPIVMPYGHRWRLDMVEAWLNRVKRQTSRTGRQNEACFGEPGRKVGAA